MHGKNALAVLIFLLILTLNSSFGADSFWPMLQRDPGHTGCAPVSISDTPNVLWSMTARDLDDSHLLLAGDGSLWTVSGYAITNVGRFGGVRSRFELDLSEGAIINTRGAAAVLPDGGIVCVGSHTGARGDNAPIVYCLNSDASLRWSLTIEGDADNRSLLTLGNNDSVYLGLGNPLDATTARLYVISKEGQVSWTYQPAAAITGVPAIDADGTVYVGCQGALFCAIEPPGILKWSYDAAGEDSSCSPTIDQSGNVYFLASRKGLFAFTSDGSPVYSYLAVRHCYTSPVILPDGSLVFLSTSGSGPSNNAICLNQDGSERWSTEIPGSTILVSPIADQNSNTYVTAYYGDPPMFTCYLGRIDAAGTFEVLHSAVGQPILAGPCMDSLGTIYCWMDKRLLALGQPIETAIGASTDLLSFPNSHDTVMTVSISLMNPEADRDADCYLAYHRITEECLWFYPFWLCEPSSSVMRFSPLPQGAYFPCVQVSRLRGDCFEPGTYQLLAGLFERGTLEPIAEIASTLFKVTAVNRCDKLYNAPNRQRYRSTLRDPTISISLGTDEIIYSAGDVLDLSLSFENAGDSTDCDLYIAATLEADPTGTLFFFPTWATDPMMTAISFEPLAHGASLPDWTIMHLPLTDGLPKGDYKFLAAFFHAGTFELVSGVAETRWTLM